MKRTYGNGLLGSVVSIVTLLLLGSGVANAQDLSAIEKPGDKGDYPVHVGKRVRWAPELYKERQEAVRRAAEAVSRIQPTSLMPVLVGKRTVAVSTSEANRNAAQQEETSVAASSEKAEQPRAKGYFEKRGRAIFWVPLPQ